MNDERRREEALFRYAVLGDLLHRSLRRGELGRALDALAPNPEPVTNRR